MSGDNFKKLIIPLNTDANIDILSAWLSYYGVESIVEEDTHLEAYILAETPIDFLDEFAQKTGVAATNISIETVVNKNWNEQWEQNFKPINIEGLYVRAPFHAAAPESDEELVIAPKMAFGTGHHETTYMMLNYLRTRSCKGKTVLDYGCGTGILAVYVARQRPSRIVGIDIQEEAIENTQENMVLNQLAPNSIELHQGDLDLLGTEQFDIILANINRHVLMNNAATLHNTLHKDGLLIISGIMLSDRQMIIDNYLAEGFSLSFTSEKGDWCLLEFSK